VLLIPYLVSAGEALRGTAFAAREDIDDAMKLGCGHPMGPVWPSAISSGWTSSKGICASLYEEHKRDEYAAPAVAEAHGRLRSSREEDRPRLL